MRKRWSGLILVLVLLLVNTVFSFADVAKKAPIIIASTTSLRDSGLFDVLIPEFLKDTGIDAKVVAVGTGQAIKNGMAGEADVLFVHDKASEIKFMAEGYGTKRWEVMYNDFIIVGPKNDPAGVKNQKGDVLKTFKAIFDGQSKFVSRGDDSGTHKKELAIWKAAGIEPKFASYVSTGSGMGEVLRITSEMQGYTLTDRATYMKLSKTLDLDIVSEGDALLLNIYGIIAINPKINANINADGAQEFIKWILSDGTQKLIGQYGVKDFGEPLFKMYNTKY